MSNVSMKVVRIGNGLYVRCNHKMSLMEQYRAKQAKCQHAQSDPRGRCYECGKQMVSAPKATLPAR